MCLWRAPVSFPAAPSAPPLHGAQTPQILDDRAAANELDAGPRAWSEGHPRHGLIPGKASSLAGGRSLGSDFPQDAPSHGPVDQTMEQPLASPPVRTKCRTPKFAPVLSTPTRAHSHLVGGLPRLGSSGSL